MSHLVSFLSLTHNETKDKEVKSIGHLNTEKFTAWVRLHKYTKNWTACVTPAGLCWHFDISPLISLRWLILLCIQKASLFSLLQFGHFEPPPTDGSNRELEIFPRVSGQVVHRPDLGPDPLLLQSSSLRSNTKLGLIRAHPRARSTVHSQDKQH